MNLLFFRSLLFLFFFAVFPGCSSSYTPIEYVQPKRKPTPISQTPTTAFVDLNRLGWVNKGSVIVIDPGHGGDDYGTNSNGNPKFYEKYLNLSTALIVKSFLEKRGFTVEMTRTDDTFISLDERAEFANQLGAKLFVSVHYNSAPSKDG